MIRFTNGGNRVRFGCAQPIQYPTVHPTTYGNRTSPRFNGDDMLSHEGSSRFSSPQLRPPSTANNLGNTGSVAGDNVQFMYDKCRGSRF